MNSLLTNLQIPICGFVAYSGTGKTTLLEKLIPILREKGLRIGLIKHAHHEFDIDHSGKDSYRLRKAGASETLVASGQRWALIHEETETRQDPDLNQLIARLNQQQLDLILVEGFKNIPFPRIELQRKILEKPLMFPHDDSIIAIACDDDMEIDAGITRLDINDVQAIASFIFSDILKSNEVCQ